MAFHFFVKAEYYQKKPKKPWTKILKRPSFFETLAKNVAQCKKLEKSLKLESVKYNKDYGF